MREILLITHFIGLAMGLGTSFGFMFLGIASNKMDKEEGMKFRMNTIALSRMGHIGLALLIISGGALLTPYLSTLSSRPLLIAKLVLVVVLGALIGVISSIMKKAREGDAEARMKKIETLGKLAMITALVIVILAVSVFH